MTKKILVTDSFFIKPETITTLSDAGYEVVHLDVPAASEAELMEAIQDVSVYILGGIEQVTDAVIEAATQLEAIIFCGIDYDKFIPGAELALSKGIKLLNAPGTNAVAVAEFAIGTAILMQRNFISISREGDKRYFTTDSLQDATIGVIGAGAIGQKIIEAVRVFAPKEIVYANRSEKDVDARYVELDELVSTADIIFMVLPMKAGQVITAELIVKLKHNALLVSISPMNVIDADALSTRLLDGTVRVVIDWPAPSDELAALPLETFYTVNSHSAYNTHQAIARVTKSVTETAINLL